MLFLFIGLVVACIVFYLEHDKSIDRITFSLFCGGLVFIFQVLLFDILFTPSYIFLPVETYALKEIQDNKFYEGSTSGDAISVYILSENDTYKKYTFDQNEVVFQDGDNAEIAIFKEAADWDSHKELMFFHSPSEKERLQYVLITVPSTNI